MSEISKLQTPESWGVGGSPAAAPVLRIHILGQILTTFCSLRLFAY